MAVFRVEKNRNYTTMANYHLCDTNLSLKAIGLLSKMLSLSDKWDYTTRGLAAICKEGVGAIGAAHQELEQFGYLVRKQHRNKQGRITDTEYIIYEKPQINPPDTTKPDTTLPDTENPYVGKPPMENPPQLNTNQSKTKESSTYQSTSPLPPSWEPSEEEDDDFDESIFQIKTLAELGNLTPSPGTYYRIKTGVQANLDYRMLCFDIQEGTKHLSLDQLNMVVEIMTETLCSTKATIRISGEDHPADMVKERLLSLDFTHVEYVLECLSQTTSHINHVKRYLLTLLYNAPTSIVSYYTAMANRHKLQA